MLAFGAIAEFPLASASKSQTYSLDALSGTFTLSMQGAGKLISDIYPSGSYILNGRAFNFDVGYQFGVDNGSYTLTGTGAETEIRTDATKILLDIDFGIPAETGVFTLTYSSDLDFQKGFGIILDSQAFVVTGQDADLIKDMNIGAASGSFVQTGRDVSVTAQLNMDADNASFTVTGTSITYTKQMNMDLGFDTYSYDGKDITILGWLEPTPDPEAWTEQVDQSDIWTEQSSGSEAWTEIV